VKARDRRRLVASRAYRLVARFYRSRLRLTGRREDGLVAQIQGVSAERLRDAIAVLARELRRIQRKKEQ